MSLETKFYFFKPYTEKKPQENKVFPSEEVYVGNSFLDHNAR